LFSTHPKHDALQNQYELLCEKLKTMRRDYAIAADTLIRFQLDKQIEQVEAEVDDLARQLESLESERLCKALLQLGYQKQAQNFRKFAEAQSVAAFLIHGCSPYYGQRWLLNRLVIKHVPNSISGKTVQINLNRIPRRSDVAALWRELSGRVGLGRQGTPAEIAERVYQWWQTQSVLLIFYYVDFLSEAYLEELIRDFWVPLETKAKDTLTSRFQLLMFMVDYAGCADGWNVPFAERFEATWKPDKPVKLPIITEFSEDELTNWLEFEVDERYKAY
jgi:inactive STAND